MAKNRKIITERPSGAASDCKSSTVTDSSLDAKIHKDRRSKHISLPTSEKVWRIYARYGGIIAERYKQSFTVDFALKNKSMPINLLMSLDID